MTMPFSFTLVFAIGGQIKHAHPGLLDEPDRLALTEIATRALRKRLAVEMVTATESPTTRASKPFPVPAKGLAPPSDTMTQSEIARAQGFTGDACNNCGQFKMKQAGHCLVCDECGSTTGCS